MIRSGSISSGSISEERLRRLVDADVIGVVIARNDGTIVEANDALLRMLGYTREDIESGELDWRRITPDEYLPLDERAIEQLETVGVFETFEKEYIRKDGTRVPIMLGGARVAGTGEQVCYILDLTNQKRAERELAISEARYRTLADSLPHIVIQADDDGNVVYINRQWTEFTGQDDPMSLESRRSVVHPDDIARLDALRQTGDSYETEMRLRKHDGSYRWQLVRVNQIESTPNAPAGRVATVIDIDARKRFETTLKLLSTAGDVFSRALGLQATLDGLLQLVVPDFGDWATITVRESDGRIHTLATRHADPAKAELARSLQGAYFHMEGSQIGAPHAYRTKEAYLASPLTEAELSVSIKPEYRKIFAEMGLDSFVAMPIILEDQVIGTLGIGTSGGRRPFTREDLPPLDGLAARAAFAIANAQTYEREHFVAQSFQQAALPPALPRPAGMRLDSYYQPAGGDSIVGGDWYDAFQLADGRLVISIGDVSGNGLAAAVKMSSVRQIIRGIAQIDPDPITMLEAADRAVRSEADSRMVTAFTGVIDPGKNMEMTYASAGHLPALVRRPDGRMEELRTPGLPLGYRHLWSGSSAKTVLEKGSSIVLFTDGLVEFAHDIRAGEASVTDAVRDLDWDNCLEPAKELCAIVLGAAPTSDDVAVLTLCVLA